MDISNVQDEPTLKDYIDVLRRRKSVVILFFVTTVLVVTIGSFIMTPVYRAKTTLLIDLENPNVLTSSGMVEIQSQNYYSYKEYYQSQKEILTSLPIAQKVFDEFKLIDMKEYSRAKEPIKKFLKTIKVEPVRDTRLLELYVDSKDRGLAARISNRIAELYVTRNLYYISKTELLNLLKNEYLKLEGKLSEYSKIYKEGHPEMVRIREEITELVDKIEKEKKTGLEFDYSEAQEANYKYALQGLKANNVSILAPAETPVIPVRPKRFLNIILALVVGLFGGIGLAFFYEYIDDTVKDTDDLEKVAGWPLLGGIPKIDSGRLTEFDKDVLVHTKPKEPIAEAYRTIRTSVLFSSTEEHPLRTMAITSPGPQEGKTTTLCNLAIAMAQNQKKVLLVDADMRNPRLHEVFKKENEKGLSTFLSGQTPFEEIAQATDIENVFLITSGFHPPNPSELLAGHKMADFLTKAKQRFDFVLLDTPPVALLTDAVILAGITDSVIMVIENEKTSKRMMPRIHKLLTDAKANVIGIVLNKVSIHGGNYYYYSYYYSKQRK